MTIVKRKLLSIIMPVFNSAGKIAATVQSVRNQDASLLEYHIVDGVSADATLDVVRSQAPEADLTSEPDAGVYDAVNKGIARSQGRFVYVLGAGDVLRPGVLARLAGRLTNMPPNSIVYGNVYWISQRKTYDGVFAKRDLTTHCICHQAMFIDRSSSSSWAPTTSAIRSRPTGTSTSGASVILGSSCSTSTKSSPTTKEVESATPATTEPFNPTFPT